MHLAMEKMWSKMFYIFLNYTEKNVDPYWSNLETYSDENENGLNLIFVIRIPAKNNITKSYTSFKGF